MAGYAFRAELKKAASVPVIDYGKPSLAPLIRSMAASLRKTAAAFQAPDGVELHAEKKDAGDGGTVTVYEAVPEDAADSTAILFLHGGGFFLPLKASQLELACFYAKELGVRVVVPDYRILPEWPAPAAFRDCMRIRDFLGKTFDKVLLYGESAGGALAAGLALRDRDLGLGRAAGQLLIYPVLDDRMELYPSAEEFRDAPWNAASNRYMWREYLKNGCEEPESWIIPMRSEKLENLPPAYVEPQEIDILRDEAEAYAGRLEADGVPVRLNRISGSFHGFDSDLKNPFVRSIAAERTRIMKAMLETEAIAQR